MPMLRSMKVCYSFSVYFPINLQGATEQLQAAVRSKAALIGVWGSPALPITKKGRTKQKIKKIHHIFTLQILGHNLKRFNNANTKCCFFVVREASKSQERIAINF